MQSGGREPALKSLFHALQLSPGRLEFAHNQTSESLNVSLENTSDKTTCFKVRLTPGDANKYKINPVTGSINAKGKMNVTVTFKPDGTRALDTRVQIKYLELEAGQNFKPSVFEEEKDSVKTLLLPFVFRDFEVEADDMFKTPQAPKWWDK